MGANTIELFMWGFQSHFRSIFSIEAERALREIGVAADHEAFLIGLLREGGVGHPLCIEPENGPLVPADFEALAARAQEIRAADPETGIWHSDARLHEQRQRRITERANSKAIAEVLEARLGGHFYLSMPTLVEQHFVYVAIGLPTSAVDEFPALATDASDDGRVRITRSLLQGVVIELLRLASRALNGPDPGSDLGLGIEAEAVAATAGRALTESAVFLATGMPSSLFAAMNAVSTALYEKRVGIGRLIVANQSSAGVDAALLFEHGARVGETRTLRKLLETSSAEGAGLLTDGREAYGLGRVSGQYDPTTESVFELFVSGPGTWDLRHSGNQLMAVHFGAPHLPRPRLSRSKFEDIAQRVLGPDTECDVDALWDLAMAASSAEHGTMLVVSSAAAEEAERLSGQAISVRPGSTEIGIIEQVTGIDGAVLVDPSAQITAIGVILDGTAAAHGDRSRGARFNSAIRYLESSPHDTLIVLVSEDGMLDLLPDLRPRIRRSVRDGLLDKLREADGREPVDADAFHKALDRVKAIAFYLTGEQCAEVNAIVERHWQRRREAGATTWPVVQPLEPHPDMSEEYLLD